MNQLIQIAPDIFQWTDTCNVYVIRNGGSGILIDLGDGSVLSHLGDIGINKLDWVLFTHHHREQCQGAPLLAKWRALGTKVAVPELERDLFEKPLSFRKMRPTLTDPHSVYGASYVRPPMTPLTVDKTFARMDDFAWGGREFWCVHIGGHSPGMMSYLLNVAGRWLAFSGDLICSGAKMHTWYDSEFDYGFAKGLYELGNNAAQIAGYNPQLLLPSHGPVIREGKAELNDYVTKLRKLGELYVRGYDINRFANCDQDNVSRPTVVPHLWQVTSHLFKFRGPDYWVNFAMIVADSGRALLIDCGLFKRDFLDQALGRAKERLGVKSIDAIFVTHMHGDHALDADYVRGKYGAKLWTMEGIADKFEHPWNYDLAALLPAYTERTVPPPGPIKFDRVLRNGETITWEDYTLTADWMPGQTKYHACLHGRIDDKTVAFTGDNLFASTVDPKQGGNEAVVARNGGTLEEGYLYAADYLHGLGPDIIVGGHCWAMSEPMELIDRCRQRMEALRESFRGLSVEDDYRYMFDPYWVQALPYRVVIAAGGSEQFNLIVRNYTDREQTHKITFAAPEGISVEPAILEGKIAAQDTATYPVKVLALASAAKGLKIIPFDISRNGIRYGQLFDVIIHVGEFTGEVQTAAPAAKSGY